MTRYAPRTRSVPGAMLVFFGTTKYDLILYLFYLRRSNLTVSERTYIIVPMV